jgi:hypothetical protein
MTVTTTRPGRDPVERTEQRIANGAAGTSTGPIDAPPRRLVTEERDPALIGHAVPVAGTEVVDTDVVELSD